MKLKIITNISIVLTFFFTLLSCNSQRDDTNHKVSLVQNDWERYNLKGKVKELKTVYERFYADTLTKEVIGKYEHFRNDFDYIWRLPTGHYIFSEYGFLTKRQDRYLDTLFLFNVLTANKDKPIFKFIYDSVDFIEKQKIKDTYKYLYPLYDPYDIKVNYKWVEKKKIKGDSTSYFNNIYQYLKDTDGKIVEEKYYMGHREVYKNSHYSRKVYSYNDRALVSIVEIFLRENSRPLPFDLESIDHLRMDLPARSSMRYEYDYDEQERITEVRFRLDKAVIWSETYRYNDNSRVPAELDRFIVSGNTNGVFLTDNATEWYNEYADIIKVEYYDKTGEVVHTRFYDYEYDEHNNWIECKMYLEGFLERTENPTRIARRTITYYPD